MQYIIVLVIGIILGMYLIHSRARFIINRIFGFWYFPIWRNKYEPKISQRELLEQIADDVQGLVNKKAINNNIANDKKLMKLLVNETSWEPPKKQDVPVDITQELSKVKTMDLIKELGARGQVKAG